MKIISLDRIYEETAIIAENGRHQLIKASRRSELIDPTGDVFIKCYRDLSPVLDWRQIFGKWSHVAGVHTAKAVDFGLWKGSPAVVFPWISGVNLQELFAAEVLPENIIEEIMTQAQLGLRELASSGLHHGDLSLVNIMVDLEGRVVLLDYDSNALDAHSLRATPHFVAPEIWLGEPPSWESDLYSLGLIEKYLRGEFLIMPQSSQERLRRESLQWADSTSCWLHPNPKQRRWSSRSSQAPVQSALARQVRRVFLRREASVGTCSLNQVELNQGKLNLYPIKGRAIRVFLCSLAMIFGAHASEATRNLGKGELSVRTQKWVRLKVGKTILGTSPFRIHLREGQHEIQWESYRRRGSKLLTVKEGEHKVLKDKDFF
jgi:serine/threonine protein kinase